jgi:hypothetical protein
MRDPDIGLLDFMSTAYDPHEYRRQIIFSRSGRAWMKDTKRDDKITGDDVMRGVIEEAKPKIREQICQLIKNGADNGKSLWVISGEIVGLIYEGDPPPDVTKQ